MVDLQHETAVITGAASGIGLGLARACISRDMSVVLSDVDEAKLEATVTSLANAGANVIGVPCDVRSADAVEALRDSALSAFGAVHLVCNNAGVGFSRPMLETDSADWDLVLDINVRGVVNGVDAFLPLFLDQGEGHISATSSLSGLVADPGLSLYNASKFAVAGIMEALGLELLEQGSPVSASVLCPGPVATALATTSATVTGSTWGQEVSDYLARGMAPDDVGELAIAQIAEGRFWLLPHPGLTFNLIDGRIAALKDGGQLFEPEVAWTDEA
jgi:NAD(P)-dependent dehydrogenase (short-subunit alcohol dehydrogenase family)